MSITTVLEMMKKDPQSTVGLTVEYDFGGIKPIVEVIASARLSEYKCTFENEEHEGKLYMISFMNSPDSYYGVYENNVKILLTGVD